MRYIHLNPIRARLAKDLDELGRYPFCGHSVIMGKMKKPWQDMEGVLGMFGENVRAARRAYRLFVEKGIGGGGVGISQEGAFCGALGDGKG